MGDLAGILPFGGGGVTVRQAPEAVPAGVPAVEETSASGGLSGRMASDQSQTQSHSQTFKAPQIGPEKAAAVPDDAQQDGPRAADPDPMPGPTPAFKVSLLEVSKDLTDALAKINVEHSLPRDREAVAPVGERKAAPEPTATRDSAPQPREAEQREPVESKEAAREPEQAVKPDAAQRDAARATGQAASTNSAEADAIQSSSGEI